jgi:hypothetical protein
MEELQQPAPAPAHSITISAGTHSNIAQAMTSCVTSTAQIVRADSKVKFRHGDAVVYEVMLLQVVMEAVLRAALVVVSVLPEGERVWGQRAPCYECEVYRDLHPQSRPYEEVSQH